MVLITNATLVDGRSAQRLLIDDGRFKAIGPDLPTPEGCEVIHMGSSRGGSLTPGSNQVTRDGFSVLLRGVRP